MCIYYYLAVLESWTLTTKEKKQLGKYQTPSVHFTVFLKQITIKHIKHVQ